MDRYFHLELAKDDISAQDRYARNAARWLASQLPDIDSERLGWSVLVVTAMLYPDWYDPALGDRLKSATRSPAESKGMSIALLLAGRVGEALIDAKHGQSSEPGAPMLEVSAELATVDFPRLVSELFESPMGTDPGQLRSRFGEAIGDLDDIRELVTEEIPGVDLRAIGRALVATALLLFRQISELPTPGRLRRKRQRRFAGIQSGMTTAAFTLGMIGDYLTSQG